MSLWRRPTVKKALCALFALLCIVMIQAGAFAATYSDVSNIDFTSYDTFRASTIGKGYNLDGSDGVQCYDGAATVWRHLGRWLESGGTGQAQGTWSVASARQANAGTEFELITDITKVKRGDIVVIKANWSSSFTYTDSSGQTKPVASTGAAGHIGFSDADYNSSLRWNLYDQNNNGHKYFESHSFVWDGCFLGAFRYKAWHTTPCLLDVNGLLDGEAAGNTTGYGTFDVYIDGVLKADDWSDYSASFPSGSSYLITDIKATDGHIYRGFSEVSALSGTLQGNISPRLAFDSRYYLTVNGSLDGAPSDTTADCGTFDVYINGGRVATNATSYTAEMQKGDTYAIENIQPTDECVFTGAVNGALSGTIGTASTTVTLGFERKIVPTPDWQETSVLPDYIDLSTCDVEYRNHYVYTGRTSPGDDWTLVEEGTVQYENDGELIYSDNPQATSDTLELIGHYYFHWCGDPNNSTNANYYQKSYLPTYHTIPMEDLYRYTVKYIGDDGDGSGRHAYNLIWKEGQWAGGIATCSAHGSGTYYEGNVYQKLRAYQINRYEKDSGWVAEPDPEADSCTVRIRLKQYLITFDPNGGEYWLTSEVKTHGVDLYLPETSPEWKGYIFVGWTLDQAGEGKKYLPEEVFTLDSEATFYAQWQPIPRMVLPAMLKTIEEAAFADCGAQIVIVPNGCESIKSNAFMDNVDLIEIHIPATVMEISFDAFENCPNLTIYAPEGSQAAKYANALHIPFEAE